MMFAQFAIRTRLLAVLLPALGLALLCTLFLAIEGYLGIKGLRQSTEALELRSIQRTAAFAELKDLINKSPISMRDIALSQTEEQRLQVLAGREKSLAEFGEKVEGLKKDPTLGQNEAFKSLDEKFSSFLKVLAEFDREWKNVSAGPLPEKHLSVLLDHIWNKVLPYRIKVQESIKELSQLELDHQKKLAQQAQAIYQETRSIIAWSSALALILTTAASILALLVLNAITKSLSSIATALRRDSESVEFTAVSLSSAATQLASATTQEASSLAETAAAMEEMTATIQKTTENVSTALEVAETSQQEAERGREVVGKMLNAMNEIQTSNAQLDQMVKLIEEIQDKTRVINDIVFETRLLSFNASIEAARAGSQGRGFAVVAEEVGNLAVVSGKAADEIRILLESTTLQVNDIVRSTQERINQGRTRAEDCKQAFGAMGENLSRVCQYVKGISAAAQEQESGVMQINRAMAQLDTVTQGNAAGAEDLNTQATQLSEDSSNMREAVAKLSTMVLGSSSAAVRAEDLPRTTARKTQFRAVTALKPVSSRFSEKSRLERGVLAAGSKESHDRFSSKESVADTRRTENQRWRRSA